MKTSDLRIGSWYLSTKFQVPVMCEMGDFFEIYARADGGSEYTVDDIFEPLPLTKEWLLKFGFKKADKKKDIFPESFIKDNVMESRLYLRPSYQGGFYWGFITQGIADPHEIDHEFYDIKPTFYVHQLQNLYWCLCGNELTVK